MSHRRRRAIQYPALTSMLDVLFILLFAALIQATALEQERARDGAAALAALESQGARAEAAAARPVAPSPPPSRSPTRAPAAAAGTGAAALRDRALDTLDAEVRARRPVVARIARDGTLRALEADGETIALELPLVEPVADPDVALGYLGDRSLDLSVCALTAVRLAAPDLAGALVVIAPDAPLVELTVALARGLQNDVERCRAAQRGLAVLVEPTATAATAAPPSPAPEEPLR